MYSTPKVKFNASLYLQECGNKCLKENQQNKAKLTVIISEERNRYSESLVNCEQNSEKGEFSQCQQGLAIIFEAARFGLNCDQELSGGRGHERCESSTPVTHHTSVMRLESRGSYNLFSFICHFLNFLTLLRLANLTEQLFIHKFWLIPVFTLAKAALMLSTVFALVLFFNFEFWD